MWEIARKNRRKSMFLLMFMGVFLVLLGYFLGIVFNPTHGGGITGIIISLVIYFILILVAFNQGKSIMLSMGKAREVGPNDYPQLYNIVEEMRLAAGMPFMPKVYVIDEAMPNAFAAGMTPKDSVVAVTTGLMRIMNRDELQGVIAHEISHIVNRDIRYMTLATIMVATVAIISQIFLRSMFFGGGNRGGGNSKGGGAAQIIMLVIAIAFAILAPILIRLLYFSLSRKREYLADASGALLTRYPEGLASALEKISNSSADMKNVSEAMAPMYIANPLKGKGEKIRNLTSTHPPLQNRIKILRSMGQEFSLSSYQEAYKQVTNKSSSFIPKQGFGK